MKRNCLALCILLVIGLVPVGLGAEKSPIIAFDSLTKDFGSVTEGQNLKHIFKFTNKGSAPLQILKHEAS